MHVKFIPIEPVRLRGDHSAEAKEMEGARERRDKAERSALRAEIESVQGEKAAVFAAAVEEAARAAAKTVAAQDAEAKATTAAA